MRKDIPVSDFSHISNTASSAPSVSSRRSSRSSFARGPRSFTSGSESHHSHHPDDVSISGKIIELEEEPEVNDADTTASMFKLLQKTVSLLSLFVNNFSICDHF